MSTVDKSWSLSYSRDSLRVQYNSDKEARKNEVSTHKLSISIIFGLTLEALTIWHYYFVPHDGKLSYVQKIRQKEKDSWCTWEWLLLQGGVYKGMTMAYIYINLHKQISKPRVLFKIIYNIEFSHSHSSIRSVEKSYFMSFPLK